MASVHAAQEAVDEPAAENVLAGQGPTTASLVAEHALEVSWPGPATVQGGHEPVSLPAAEKVLAAHDAMTASAEAEHCVVTRCPGPAVEQGGQAPVWLPATENVPEAARLEAIFGVERARAAAKLREAMRHVPFVVVWSLRL